MLIASTRSRKVPNCSKRNFKGLSIFPEFCRSMTKLPLIIVYCYVIMVCFTSAARAQIQGSVASCDREGEEIFVAGISTDPCISCRCERHEVQCFRATCPDNAGCHVILYDKPDNQCCEACQGCQHRGKVYASGTQWSDRGDPCRVITCQAGVLTTSIQRCHVTCKNPRLVTGECCPQCDGCYVNGVNYLEGQTFPSPRDPCTVCTCQNGSTSCHKELCPVLNCPEDSQFQPAGSCCPACEGTRRVYMPPRGRCLFQKSVHENRSLITPDTCTQCSCQSGTMQCDRKSCPILDCASDDVILSPDTCCPRCQQTKRRCKFIGQKYQHQSVWKMDLCTHCMCDDGTVRCQTETCNNILECPNNTRLKMQQGQCCPQCVDDGALCTVFGDPHYRTFDGRVFNFQGTCDYTLTKTCQTNDMSVIVRNDARTTNQYAWTKSVRVQVGGAKIYFLQKNRVKVNKKRVQLPYVHRRSKFSIVTSGRSVALKTAQGSKVTWDGDSYLEVYVPPKLKNKMCGLCGNYNNDKTDDLIGPDGAMYIDADEFGSSWTVDGKRCPSHTASISNSQRNPCTGDPNRREQAELECGALYDPRFEPCLAKNDVDLYYQSCLTDMCECPKEKNCFCESLKAYSHACKQDGYDVDAYLPTICKASNCPRGALWVQCASACPRTCDSSDDDLCNEPCTPGCQCPANKVLHNNRCIKPKNCPNTPQSGNDNDSKKKKKKKKKYGSPLDYLIEGL